MHPQTVFDGPELTRLQDARTGSHAGLAANMKRFLDNQLTGVTGAGVGGYAIMARIWEDNTQYAQSAVASLMAHCRRDWPMYFTLSSLQRKKTSVGRRLAL
jgi:hypothetical protein